MRINPKRLLRKMISVMPPRFRHSIIRSMVTLPTSDLPNLRVKIAHRKNELEQAFGLLHEAYVNAGFMTANEAKLRVTKYHALPSTTTIVAMEGEHVVGTVSVVRDGLLGFPSDVLVDKTDLRRTGARIAEVSSLAICSKYRKKSHGSILWPLIAHLVRYSRDYFGTDYFVIAVHPKQFSFYESVLFFERLTQEPIKTYGFVNDNPAMCGLLDLRKFPEYLQMEYGRKNDLKNVFAYVFERQHDFLRFPRRDNFKISDPFLTPDLLTYFFKERTSVFETLTPKEIVILHRVYFNSEYHAVLPPCDETVFPKVHERTSARFDVACKGRFSLGSDRDVRLQVQNVSERGFYAVVSDEIPLEGELKAEIAVAEFKIAAIACRPVWREDECHYGFRVVRTDQNWQEFIGSLTRDLHQEHSEPPFSALPEAI